MENLRERFLKTYVNIPLNLRDEIILVLDKEMSVNETKTIIKDSISWRVAYIEVDQRTKLSEVILGELAELDLI